MDSKTRANSSKEKIFLKNSTGFYPGSMIIQFFPGMKNQI
jgi:hypothetical protein